MDATPPTDLAADLQTRGCAVCDHLATRASDFFAQWQYALYADKKARDEYAAELGFCPLHFWQLEGVSSLVGVAIGHAPLVERIARELEQFAAVPSDRRRVERLVPRVDDCRVCRLLRATEAAYLGRLAAFVAGPEGQEHYARSHGLCRRHLASLVNAVPADGIAVFLLDAAARHFRKIGEDMRGYADKTAALRRELYTDGEEDAARRALTHLAGSRRVCWP
ncbi:MAG TPA: hypothetical protein VLW52_02850 [Opitutaceae bacterium]|nr:hypothetical protein [Opitutaceae bacterium]